jgi:hypothetical protein
VANRRWILLLLSTAMISVSAACGGGSSLVQNPTLAAKAEVSIGFHPTPAGSIFINGTTTFTAVVTNDPSNAGVDWALPCPTGSNCGQLVPLHSESGKAVTYTPPPTLAGNSQTVTVLAFATIDHTKNVLTPITVKGFAGNFKGTYILQTLGVDVDPVTGALGPYQFASAIVLDGNGAITSGEQTYSNSSRSVSDPVTGGTYYIGPDGRGTLTIKTGDKNIGQQGMEFFSLVFLSSSQALIAKIDDPANSQFTSSESSSGTIDLQTSKAAPQGGYAFVVNGTDTILDPMAVGGIFNIDSPKTISGAGSVADQDLAGTVFPRAKLSGTVSDPDSFGAVKFDLTIDFASSPIEFTGYIVDAVHIKLVESDNGSGTGFGSMGGLAIAQGAATGTFKGQSAFSGAYVFGNSGIDLYVLSPASFASVGVFTADGLGNLTGGFDDKFLVAVGSEISDSFKGRYTVDSKGTGRVNSHLNFPSRSTEPGAEFIFYLTGNGNPPLILDADGDVNFFGPVAVGTGVAYPQAAPPFSFSGKYGFSFTLNQAGSESDATAVMNVDGTARTLSGIVDTNFSFSPALNTPLTGTFQTSQTAPLNRFTGTLFNQFFPTNIDSNNDISVVYYIIDSNHGFFAETDTINTNAVTFGHFATRTPVCSTCP